ncbi:hypothetical protein VTK56DRAFT_8889 [Thermocarpiscus australiensis]
MSSISKSVELRSGVKLHTLISSPPASPRSTSLPTVVFLHFWGGSANTWSLVSPRISETYPTVALDFRGWGNSTGPAEEGAYSIATLADDVEEVIARLHINHVVLAGLSMGAKVAQLVAARWCSQRDSSAGWALHGIVLVSPAPPTPLTLPPDMREQQLHAYDNEDSASFVAANVLTVTFRSRELPGFVVHDMLRGNKWAREAWPAYAMAEDLSEAVRGITVPVLVLAAAEDIVEPLERVQTELCSRLSEPKLEIISGSGHLSPLDAPEAVARHLLQFLAEL